MNETEWRSESVLHNCWLWRSCVVVVGVGLRAKASWLRFAYRVHASLLCWRRRLSLVSVKNYPLGVTYGLQSTLDTGPPYQWGEFFVNIPNAGQHFIKLNRFQIVRTVIQVEREYRFETWFTRKPELLKWNWINPNLKFPKICILDQTRTQTRNPRVSERPL